MKKTIIILFCAMFIFCSCEGDRGLTGDAGKDLEINVITGTLKSLEPDDPGWEINTWFYTSTFENFIITVAVKFTDSDIWFQPVWYYGFHTVLILDNEDVDPGNEYRITIAK